MTAMFRSLSADETSDMVVARTSLVPILVVILNIWHA